MKVIILGGGITGLFASYYLRRRGHDVLVINRQDPTSRTSIYNAGLLTPSLAPTPEMSAWRIAGTVLGPRGPIYISPVQIVKNLSWFLTALRSDFTKHEDEIITIGRRSLELYDRFFKEETLDVDIIQGVIGVYVEEQTAAKMAEKFEGKFVQANDLHSMGLRKFGGGVLFEKELSLNPAKLFNGMNRLLMNMGVRFENSQNSRLLRDGAKVQGVLTDGGIAKADAYLVTAGSRCNDLLQALGQKIPVLPARGLAIIYDTHGMRIVSHPVLLEDYGIAIVQHNSTTLRITSFFEVVGYRTEFGDRRKEWLIQVVKRHLNGFDTLTLAESGVGYRPCSPDQLPIIGRVPHIDNCYVATGNCRLGVTLAPATAMAVAGMIEGKDDSGALEFFNPSRFSKMAS